MAKNINQKASAVITSVALPVALENIAAQIAGAMMETASLSETLGTLTRDAGKLIKKNPDMIDPFVDACRQLCASVGLTEGSFKVYMSNIRGVIRAMVGGYAPKDGQSLRAMYDAAPKGTGRQAVKTGARHDTDKAAKDDGEGADDAPVAPATPSKADAKRAAILTLFGHCDDEMVASIDWAISHEARFLNLIAMQVALDARPVGTVAAPKARKAA